MEFILALTFQCSLRGHKIRMKSVRPMDSDPISYYYVACIKKWQVQHKQKKSVHTLEI